MSTATFHFQNSPMSLHMRPMYEKTRLGEGERRTFLVSLQAPETEHNDSNKVSLNLGVALDCSGSMQGRPLQEAKNAILHLAKSLGDNDRMSLVTYADDVIVNMTSRLKKDAVAWLQEALPTIGVRGMTALHAGWLGACGEIAPFVSQYGITRAIVLSDGQANVGETNPERLANDAKELLEKGISVSTYGIGSNFNEALMTKLAEAGGGQSVYAENADALLGHFVQEMGMMHHAVARNIRLSATWRGKNAQLENGEGNTLLAPLVLAGAETWGLFTVDGNAVTEHTTLDVTVVWQDTTTNVEHSASMTVPVVFGERDENEDSIVKARLAEAQAAKLAEEVAKQAQMGNLQGAWQTLNSMNAIAANSSYAQDIHTNLVASLQRGDMLSAAKEAHYSAQSMRKRVTDLKDDGTGKHDRYATRKVAQGRAKEGDA